MKEHLGETIEKQWCNNRETIKEQLTDNGGIMGQCGTMGGMGG